jgi:hypothetical protein
LVRLPQKKGTIRAGFPKGPEWRCLPRPDDQGEEAVARWALASESCRFRTDLGRLDCLVRIVIDAGRQLLEGNVGDAPGEKQCGDDDRRGHN